MVKSMEQHIELFFKEGSSDKVYKANLVVEGSGFMVNFAYGRRGAAFTIGQKTPQPVALEQAQKIYNKLIQEKTAKGYTEDSTGKSFSGTITEVRDTGIRPQLLNEVEEEEVMKYINHPAWCAQEKFDGRRRMIMKNAKGEIVATNRKGLTIPVTAEILKDMALQGDDPVLHYNLVLDGEDMGDSVMIFDMLDSNLIYKERYEELVGMFNNNKLNTLKLVGTAWTTAEKSSLYKRLKKANAEGIVFKRIDSMYKPGRPSSGGDHLKFKFCATATCMVSKVNDTKRSVSLSVFDNANKVNVGNVTVYPNQAIPELGAIVEVKYLYYFEGGSLFQPVLLGLRDDMGMEDCVLSQLKIKRDDKN